MINRALATGMPVNVSPKYWAEHLGLPYHQAAIRELEMPVEGHTGRGLMALSEGSRSFTRYGYADLLRDDRRYTVRHRVFSGTQRLLLSADPLGRAAYSRMFQFCGSTGMDLMEPLTFRGRRGSGHRGHAPERLPGRSPRAAVGLGEILALVSNVGAADVQRRCRSRGSAAPAGPGSDGRGAGVEPGGGEPHPADGDDGASALGRVRRLLARGLLEPADRRRAGPNPYGDTPAPRVFTTSARSTRSCSRAFTEAAARIALTRAERQIHAARGRVLARGTRPMRRRSTLAPIEPGATPTLRRLVVDVTIQAGLGRFFAAKFRAGVSVRDPPENQRVTRRSTPRSSVTVGRVRRGRNCRRRRGVYAADLSISDRISEHGHWRDRLAAIDEDIARMAQRLAASAPDGGRFAAFEQQSLRRRRGLRGRRSRDTCVSRLALRRARRCSSR